jgi:transposase
VKPIPSKLREAIIRARHDGFSYSQTAALLGVGYATVNRILRLHRETSSVEPRPAGGGNRSPVHGSMAKLLVAIIRDMPDATVAELTEALISRSNTATSRSAVHRALVRLGYSRKKSPSSPWSATRPSVEDGGGRSARSSRSRTPTASSSSTNPS